MSRGGTTLYVTGFNHGTRARDLAYEFERYGRLVRCDIPAPRSSSSRLFAFVEYEDRRDADDAYHEMHNKRLGRDEILKIEWARSPRPGGGRAEYRGRGRSASPSRRSPRPDPYTHRGNYARDGKHSPDHRARRSPRGSPSRGDKKRRSRTPDGRARRDQRPGDDLDRNGDSSYRAAAASPRYSRDRPRDHDRGEDLDMDRDNDVNSKVENGANGDDGQAALDSPPPTHDDLDVAE